MEQMLPEMPIHFVYLSPDGTESDREFNATCISVPHIGETVIPQAGSRKVIVANVYHKFITNEQLGDGFYQYITVCLKEFPAQ